jgi:putative hydrolase of the HAD superfamily
MIKALIFDLDNTLYDERGYLRGVFGAFSERHGIDFQRIDTHLTGTQWLKSRDIFGDLLKKIDYYSSERQEELFELYQNLNVDIRLYADASVLIEKAGEKGVRLGIITNGVVKAQKNKIRCLGIENKFDSVVYARIFGKEHEKPRALPFEQSLRELGVGKSEAIFAGDDLNTDIAGARSFGMTAVLVDRSRAALRGHAADSIVHTLTDLEPYIQG